MAKNSLITRNSDDTEENPVLQVVYYGKAADAVQLMPYGLTSRPIEGDTFGLIIDLNGQEENRVCLPFSTNNRKKSLKDGEVVLENPKAGSFLYLDEGGNLTINIPSDLTETVKNITITGENITGAFQAVTINAETVNLTATTVNIAADVNITGGFTVNGVSMDENHRHTGVSSGNQNSGGVKS